MIFWSLHKTKILTILLMLSMAFNIGLISWIGGKKTAGLHHFQKERMAEFKEIVNDLPADKRQETRQYMRKNREAIKNIRSSIKAKRQEIRTLMEQETVDKQAIEKTLSELRELNLKAMEMMHEMAAQVFTDLPQEKRKEIMTKHRKDFR